jgi:putative endonuclease
MARETSMGDDTWHVYLLECADGTFYCGIAKDLERRLAEHNGALPSGARYTRWRRPVRLLASKCCIGRGAALKLERAVKSLPRQEKLLFMQNNGISLCSDC